MTRPAPLIRRPTALAAGAAILLVALGAVAAEGWRTFTSTEYSFSIDAPAEPTRKEIQGPDGTTASLFNIESGGNSGSILVFAGRVGPETRATADELQSRIDLGMPNTPARTVLSATRLTVSGAPAQDLVVRLDGTGYLIHDRFVLRGGMLYQVIVTTPEGAAPWPDAARVTRSFKLLGD